VSTRHALRRRGLLYLGALTLVAALLTPTPAAAWDPFPAIRRATSRIEVTADLQSLFLFRTDSDFDRTPPVYDENGQTVGAFATLFRPRVIWCVLDNLRIQYEVELGLNFWSKNNPNEQSTLAADLFLLKHREIFGEGELARGRLGFKIGYSYFRDPTGLFLAHWIGNAQLWGVAPGWGRVGLFVGQIPDQVYEGIVVTENNFKRDLWVFGANLQADLGAWVRLSAAVTALLDTHLVGQARKVLCPSLRLGVERPRWSGYLDLAFQAGQLDGQALGGGSETLIAWAAQAGGGVRLDRRGRWELGVNVVALSPDDAYPGNGSEHSFLYSGKSRSATLLLTEDELRDWYDNLDERMSSFTGGFFNNRAGLLVGDLRASVQLNRWVRPMVIVGAATVLKPQNALGNAFVGVETDVVLELKASEHLVAHLVGSALVPGAAGAALVNHIRRDAVDPMFAVEASVMIRY